MERVVSHVTAVTGSVRSTTIDATYIVEFFPAYYIFNSMLIGLLVLHCIWTYYILLMAYQALSAAQVRILFIFIFLNCIARRMFLLELYRPLCIARPAAPAGVPSPVSASLSLYLVSDGRPGAGACRQIQGDSRSDSSEEVSSSSEENALPNSTPAANGVSKPAAGDGGATSTGDGGAAAAVAAGGDN